MALVECRECGKEYSDSRVDCHHCGAYREGVSPDDTALNTEMMQVARERKYNKDMICLLNDNTVSENLKTYKNGRLKDHRTLMFGYLHTEIISFNSYIDTDVEAEHSTINEATGAYTTTDYHSYDRAHVTTNITTRARKVVSGINVTKTKITEITAKNHDGEPHKYCFRGPDIEFLSPGDPITIGYLLVSWDEHTDDVEKCPTYGIAHEDAVCPVILINRKVGATRNSSYVAESQDFENDVFDDKLGNLKYTLIGSFLLDVFIGSFPLFMSINLIALAYLKYSMKSGQKERINEFRSWWAGQADNAIAAADSFGGN